MNRYLDRAAPIGRRLETRGRTYVITGVVATTVSEAFDEPPAPVLYFSYRDLPAASGEIHVLGRRDARAPLPIDLQQAVRGVEPGLPVYDVRTLAEHVERNLVLQRIPARIFIVVGPLLLALAAIGIYAVVSFTVSRRLAEIGVCLAVGGSPRRVILQTMATCFRPIGLGVAAGWILALDIDLLLFHGGRQDAALLAGVPGLLLAVAACACWIPARRAVRANPMTALRAE